MKVDQWERILMSKRSVSVINSCMHLHFTSNWDFRKLAGKVVRYVD